MPTNVANKHVRVDSLDAGITFIVFDAHSPRNPGEYPYIPYISRNQNYGGLRKKLYFYKSDVSVVQGRPSSLILVPIESAYATSY